jgi:hypothetical protein
MTPHQHLAAEMLKLAVNDARYTGPDRPRSRRANLARRWLLGYPALLGVHQCCDGLGTDADVIRSRMGGLLTPVPLPPRKAA